VQLQAHLEMLRGLWVSAPSPPSAWHPGHNDAPCPPLTSHGASIMLHQRRVSTEIYPGRACSGQAIRVRVEIMGLIMTRTTILHFCDPIISPPAPVLRAEAACQDVIDRRTTGAASASSPQAMHGGGGRPGVGPESSSLLSAGYMVVGASGSHMSAGSMPTPERQLTHDLQRVFHSEQRPMQMSRGGGAPQPSGSSSEQPPPAAVGPGQPSSHQ
jgi:hypothetical protein